MTRVFFPPSPFPQGWQAVLRRRTAGDQWSLTGRALPRGSCGHSALSHWDGTIGGSQQGRLCSPFLVIYDGGEKSTVSFSRATQICACLQLTLDYAVAVIPQKKVHVKALN